MPPRTPPDVPDVDPPDLPGPVTLPDGSLVIPAHMVEELNDCVGRMAFGTDDDAARATSELLYAVQFKVLRKATS
jgi:hypothetical protein